MRHVEQQHVDDVQQHGGVGVVEIDLIGAEGGPHFFRARRSGELGQQGQRARAHHLRQIGIALDDDEVIMIFRIVAQKSLEPLALRGDVIDHPVEHQVEVLSHAGHIVPRAQRGIHLFVIDDGKAVVGGIGIERQDMNTVYDALQMLIAELRQRAQRRAIGFAQLIAVGDEDGPHPPSPSPGTRSKFRERGSMISPLLKTAVCFQERGRG